MRKFKYILVSLLIAFSFSASSFNDAGALNWYGYDSLIASDVYTNNQMDDSEDGALFRKRRHRRRRKIGPSKKGW